MSIDQESRSNTTAPMQNGLAALCAVGTVLLIWWLLKYSAYGIDFSDESFYLVWIANPFLYDGSTSQFGFIYNPLHRLLGGDIASLRQANILITFALAWGLTYSFLVSIGANLKERRIPLLVVSAALATSAFILFDSWLATPSYNSLNLQALLIAATGVVLAEKTADCKSIFGWGLIGIGGWLAFMAKPSTVLGLAFGIFCYLLLSRKISIRMLLLAVVCAIIPLFLSALLIDGSIAGFIKRILLGIELTRSMGGGHDLKQILRIDEFQIDARFKAVIFILSAVLSLALIGMFARKKPWSFIGPIVSIAFFVFTAVLILGQTQRVANFGQFQGLFIFSVIYALAITAAVVGRLQAFKSITAQQWSIAALFLLMPHIYAFGTNGNYWRAGSSAALFWLLSGLTLLGPLIRNRGTWILALPVAFATQAITATLLQTGLEQPYRQPQPLRLNSSVLEIGPHKSPLILSQKYAEYISIAVSSAHAAGFFPNTPVIDLTGQSPGILYAIGAKSIGQAWMIGGYPKSLLRVQKSLLRVSCEEIINSWILTEPEGPRKIPSELLNDFGAGFPNNYQLVGWWLTAEGAGGYTSQRVQELYKPIHTNIRLDDCQRHIVQLAR